MNSVIETFEKYILSQIFITIEMLVISSVLSLFLGLGIAITIASTEKKSIMPNILINKSLVFFINFVMSFPFIILAVFMIPITKMIVGTTSGPIAAIVPLCVAESPYVAKLFTDSFLAVDKTVMESAKAFGASKRQQVIILIHNAMPNLIQDFTTSIINVLNDTSLLGTIGAGGIGAAAFTYGYKQNRPMVIVESVIVLVFMVYLFQFIGNCIYKKVK